MRGHCWSTTAPRPRPHRTAGASGVRSILQEAARLIAITREISGLAAAPASQWQLASINEIVTHTLGVLRYEPRLEDVKVSTALDPQLPAVMAYADRLVQMLSNLVINAADATSGLPAHAGRIAITTRQADGGVELRVDDNGCGLSPDVVARAFEPLFTTKPAGRGTGLGLPLCRPWSRRTAAGSAWSRCRAAVPGPPCGCLSTERAAKLADEFLAADSGHRR